MKLKLIITAALALLTLLSLAPQEKEFQGQAIYISKSKMELGSWGKGMSEEQKKQVYARLKNRLEKTYLLNFNKEESLFKEEEKLDAISGATDTWGKNFAQGDQYKNVQENKLVQSQEFYGKQFLVIDQLQNIDWKMGSESKQIGEYLCLKATASIPTKELTWYDFSWSDLRRAKTDSTNTSKEPRVEMTEIEAWYTPQIPIKSGPGAYWGLPGLILEVSAGNQIMLCSKIVINPKEKIKIESPSKGKEITKSKYQSTIRSKMIEMRDSRGRRN
ncbi:MAG: GLPGLI family protein [Vicingaceae bacterium]|nr:GLPGLI family protein [Vicingaceae bacterium]